MKSPILNLLFLIFPFTAFTQQEKQISIGGFEFTITKTSSKEFLEDSIGTAILPESSQLTLYRNGKKLLSHTLSKKESDCNSISLELGSYKIEGSSIIFYSYWAWWGSCYHCPFGYRRQVYSVDSAGKLLPTPTLSEVFIESRNSDFDKMSDTEKATHITLVEKKYNAKFVAGTTSFYLQMDASKRIYKDLEAITWYWDKKGEGYRPSKK